MTVFRVVDFEKYQHYRDRSPPWIKLYNDLLENYAFGRLADAQKAHLIAIWLLASRLDNCLPLDAAWVARRINASEPVNLDALRDGGFIEAGAAGKMLARCKRRASTEGESESEGETEKEAEQNLPSDPRNADADNAVLLKGSKKRSKRAGKTYPDAFEAFWREYPADPVMSKIRAYEKWKTLNDEDRRAAQAALAPFRDHCRRNPTYHPVHAERFLSQRRFDGFGEAPRTPEAPLKAMWGGAAAPLVEEIGGPAFQAYFGEASFEPGPPARIRIARPVLRDLAREKFAAALGRALGDVEVVE